MDICELSEFELDAVNGGSSHKESSATIDMGIFGTLTVTSFSKDNGRITGGSIGYEIYQPK